MLRGMDQMKLNESEGALFTAVLGEVGNNCFDHNLGQWRDVGGCLFQYGLASGLAWGIVTDRGQGVLSSLKQVIPNIHENDEALEIAFYKKISGRSPEKRGNGLKFVRSVINGNSQRGLFFVSGSAFRIFGGLQNEIKEAIQNKKISGVGTLALVLFGVTK